MKDEPKALVEGVNSIWKSWIPPVVQAPDRKDDNAREVLLVDHRGRPLLVRQPRPVGFRKP